jgi:O-antigen/teichoic acid export membrane protein
LKLKFITNLALLLFLNLLVKPFWIFGIDRAVQNTVGAEEYGLYFSLLSFSILLNILLDVGITNYNNRNIAQSNELLDTNLSLIIPLKLLLGVIYALVVLAAGLALGYSSRQFGILSVLVVNQFLLSFILYLRSNISGLHLFRTDSLLSVLDRVLMILICSVLLWGNLTNSPIKIEWFVYAQTLSYLLTGLLALFIVYGKTGHFRLNLKIKPGLAFLKQAYPYALVILLMSFFNRIDSVMLERILPEGTLQAGIYAQGFRILDAAAMFAFLFASLLLPIFAKMIKNGEHPGEMLKLSFSLIIIPAFALCTASFFYSYEIIELLYNEQTVYSSGIYQILIFGYVFISVSYIFGTLLTANGNLRILNRIAFFTLLLNISLNLLLIPVYKAKGAAIAAVSSQAFFSVLQMVACRRVFKLHLNRLMIARILVLAFIMVAFGFLIKNLLSNWIAGLFLIFLSSVLFAWWLKIISYRGLVQIIKR